MLLSISRQLLSLRRLTVIVVAFLLLPIATTHAFINSAFQRVQKDYLSLTRRVTARHILVPDEKVAMVLKQKIRDECVDKQLFVIDAFEEAAKKYSRDDTTNYRGGLLGERVPQGEVIGPVETDYGYHLILVSERTNCPNLDGNNTFMMQTRGDDVFGTLREGKQFGKPNIPQLFVDQLGFWSLTLVAGGICAELSQTLVLVIN